MGQIQVHFNNNFHFLNTKITKMNDLPSWKLFCRCVSGNLFGIRSDSKLISLSVQFFFILYILNWYFQKLFCDTCAIRIIKIHQKYFKSISYFKKYFNAWNFRGMKFSRHFNFAVQPKFYNSWHFNFAVQPKFYNLRHFNFTVQPKFYISWHLKFAVVYRNESFMCVSLQNFKIL